MSAYYGISAGRGGPFARMNWDSPASVSDLDNYGPAARPTSGQVVLLSCGCASWLTFTDVPDVLPWPDCRLVPFRWENGRKVSDDGPLPSWQDCTHD